MVLLFLFEVFGVLPDADKHHDNFEREANHDWPEQELCEEGNDAAASVNATDADSDEGVDGCKYHINQCCVVEHFSE